MRISFILFLLTLAYPGFSQTNFKTSYAQLKEFEGEYEYLNQSKLKIAASPKDTILFAIINESRYPLVPVGTDLFLNSSKEKVQFLRNTSRKITGYQIGTDRFQLISNKVNFPREMWFPRQELNYVYQQPVKGNDGLATGPIENSGLDKMLVNEMMNKIIDGTYPNVHSVLVIKKGKLVVEEYFYEYNKTKLHELRSATKSFVSALTGIAIEKGYIKSVNETVLSQFPEYSFQNNSDLKRKITIENLLTNQSGLDCDVSNPKATGNENEMGYSADWIQYTLDLPMLDTPGAKGMYCSGNPITLGRIIENSTKQSLPDFAKQTLFKELDIQNFKWSFKTDPSSAETFCQLYLTPRDMAKFGVLYLNAGVWKGKQVISKEWVSQSFKKHSVVQGVDYGYLWWIKYLDSDGTRYYGKAAQGNGGQKIYIFQELDLVIVITGGNYNSQSPSDELIRKYLLPSGKK